MVKDKDHIIQADLMNLTVDINTIISIDMEDKDMEDKDHTIILAILVEWEDHKDKDIVHRHTNKIEQMKKMLMKLRMIEGKNYDNKLRQKKHLSKLEDKEQQEWMNLLNNYRAKNLQQKENQLNKIEQ
jgi:hypothetical protein